MTIDQLISAFGPSALPAVAILVAVKMMLAQYEKQRITFEEAINKMAKSHERQTDKTVRAILRVIKAVRPDENTDDLLNGLNDNGD